MSRPATPEDVDQDAVTRIDLSVPTALIRLTPELRDALRKLAPKKPPSRLPFVVASGLVMFWTAFACEGSCRELALDRAETYAVAARLVEPREPEPEIDPARIAQRVGALPPELAIADGPEPTTAPRAPPPARRHGRTSRR